MRPCPSLRVLLDDDQGVQNLLLKFFEKKGYTDIRDAATGKEAILKVQEDIPVIIITGYPDLEIARNILKGGAYDFIVKPFDLDYLEKSVLTKTFFVE